jgi:tagaturonate reductase
MTPYALLSGLETVKDCMDDPRMHKFLEDRLFCEIIPSLDMDRTELEEYASDVLTRFANPYIKHYLSAISLNSVSKFKVRVLPSILDLKRKTGSYPEGLLFSFARLIEFYKKGEPKDSPEVIEYMRKASVEEILANDSLWGEDLSALCEGVKKYEDTSL